jgi:molecular chaperone GrpE
MSAESTPPDDRPAGAPPADGTEPWPDNSAAIPVEVEPPDGHDAATVPAEPPAKGSGVIETKGEAKPEPASQPKIDPQALRISELEDKLAAAEKDKKDTHDRLLRSAADLENLRKRQKRELEDAKIEARGKALKEVLPVVDNLERAIEHASAQNNGGEGPNKALIDGVQLVLRQLLTAFERLEVVPIDALNQAFDPNLHEAISQIESELAPGTVVQVLQRGYRSGGDRLLRPALVVVAKAKAE